MTAREPQEMAQVAAETGAKKTHRTWDRVLVSAFLGNALGLAHGSRLPAGPFRLLTLGLVVLTGLATVVTTLTGS